MPQPDAGSNYAALVPVLPTPTLLLDAAFVVLEASDTFLALTRRARADLIGRPLLAAFPTNPDRRSSGQQAREQFEASLRRALTRGEPDVLPLVRYDMETESGGPFQERWWRIISTPVPGADGTPAFVLNTVQDVTAQVADHERHLGHLERESELLERTRRLETDLSDRARQVRQLSVAEAEAAQRLQGLAYVALELAAAESVEELTDLVVGRGLAAMGCDGGGVAVRDDGDEVVRLTTTDTRGSGRRLHQQMPLSTHLPAVVAAVVPEPIYLGNRAEGLAWGADMELVYDTSGRDAWACLPLLAGDQLLGSLTVSWVQERTWTPDERALLAAFAAQCAQALQRLQVRDAEREAMATSRLLSQALQASLLTEPPQPDHLQLEVRYLPAAREAYVGGDWYDAFAVPGGDTLLVIGDVAGHDRLATAGMAQIRGVLRGVAHSLDGWPAQVLTALDAAMRDLPVDALATAVLARVQRTASPSSGQVVRWSNAGHPPPLLLTPGGSTELLRREPELMLGVQQGTRRTDHTVVLAPGATLLLYTDGLVERRGETLTQGLEWLARRVAALSGLPLGPLCDALLAEVPRGADDDVALLAVRAHAEVPREPGPRPPVPVPVPELEGLDPGRTRPRHEASLVLAPDVAAVHRARAFVRHQCRAAGLGADTSETVALLTSETVTNAFVHGRSEARLRLRLRPGRVRVEVGDDNSRHPQRAERQEDALDGRGLGIIDLLSSRWGVMDDPSGKVVWFEVDTQLDTEPNGQPNDQPR